MEPFGNSAYKCKACGTILKDEPEEKPVEAPHYVAPTSSFEEENRFNRDDYRDNDDGDFTKKIVGGVIGMFAFIVIVLLKTCPSEKPVTNDYSNVTPILPPEMFDVNKLLENAQHHADSAKQADFPDPDAVASYEERGIKVKDVVLMSYDRIDSGKALTTDQEIKISLKSPKGFTKKGNKIFLGISFTINSESVSEAYSSGDINETAGMDGEDFSKYSKSIDINFSASSVYGFTGRGNYEIVYRVWDKKSSNEINGKIPVFVQQ